jgi:hypothetical protein
LLDLGCAAIITATGSALFYGQDPFLAALSGAAESRALSKPVYEMASIAGRMLVLARFVGQ